MAAVTGLDLGGLARRTRTAEQLISELSKIGQVEHRRRLETTVDDLREKLSITSGARVPICQDVSVARDGQVTPSVTYESVGTILDLHGRWLTGHRDPTAILNVSLEDRSTVYSLLAMPGGIQLQCRTEMEYEQSVRVASGQPVVLASSGAEVTGDGDQVRLGLAVITATRLGGEADDALSDRQERARAKLAGRKAAQCARVQLDLFEVPMAKDALVELDTSTLTSAAPAQDLLGRLKELGPVQLRYRVDRPIVLTEPDRLTRSAHVPRVAGVTMSARGGAVPSIAYEEIGYILELGGRWREDAPDTADLAISFEYSGIGETAIHPASGINLPSFATHELNQHLAVRAGEPVILVATDLPVPGDEKTLPRLLVCRLVVTRDQG